MNKIDPASDLETLLAASKEVAPRPILRRRWTLVAVLIAATTVGVLFFRGSGGGNATFITEPVTRADLTVTVTATGKTKPRNEVSVGIEVSGTIADVYVDFNDAVRAGDVLARLDTTILTAQLEQSKASMELAIATQSEAEATLRQSDAELARLLKLQETSGGVLPAANDLDAAQATADRAAARVENAKAQVRQARAQLAAKQTELDLAQIVSPIDGVVLSRNVDPGQTVAATFQTPELFVIAEDLAEMQLSIEIDEADVGQVREGQVAVFTVDAYPDDEFPAEIETLRYAPISSAGVVTYEAILSVDNSDLRLRPGMTATAIVTVQQVDDALLIPNSALRFAPRLEENRDEGGIMDALVPRPLGPNAPANLDTIGRKRTVWELDESGDPRPVDVLIGATDGNRTEIVGGELGETAQLIIEQADLP